MRTNEFTFKKTKRVKTVVEIPAISVDLTKGEAALLAFFLNEGSYESEEPGTPEEEAMAELYKRLVAFGGKL